MRMPIVALALVVASAWAGCVEDRRPILELAVDPAAVPQGATVHLRVTFAPGAAFAVDGPQGCIRPEAQVRVDDRLVFFDWPAGEVMDCTSEDPKTIGADDTSDWDLELDLGEFVQAGLPLFRAGTTYTVFVDLVGRTPWDVANAVTFRVTGEDALPRVEVEPEADEWRAGEVRTIRAVFLNTASRTFSYTSPNTCNVLRVWVEDTNGPATARFLAPTGGEPVCGQALTRFEITPGERVETTVSWDGSRNGGGFVAPGTYVVKADFGGTDHAWETEGLTQVSIEAAGE